MKNIEQILRIKGNQVWKVSPTAHVFEALEIMATKDVGALLVMEGDQLMGVFSERDYARKVILLGKSSHELHVNEIMSSPPIFITPEETTEQALALMTAKRIRHLPVMDKGKVVGIITIGDLVSSLIDEQKVVIHHLEKHILSNTSLT